MGLRRYLRENVASQFDNWVVPDDDKLKLEFKVEHELKENDFFDSFGEFRSAVKSGKVQVIDRNKDKDIQYRSRTKTKSELLNLIRTYRSYPQFRNELTIDNLYDGFENNKPMEMPIVIEFKNKKRRIMAGNTRMDVAFMLKINPKVLIIKSKREY